MKWLFLLYLSVLYTLYNLKSFENWAAAYWGLDRLLVTVWIRWIRSTTYMVDPCCSFSKRPPKTRVRSIYVIAWAKFRAWRRLPRCFQLPSASPASLENSATIDKVFHESPETSTPPIIKAADSVEAVVYLLRVLKYYRSVLSKR